MFDVESVLKAIGEDSSDFDLITWSGSVDVVTKQDNILVPWNSAWGDSAWGLLHGELLVVPVDGHLLVN